MCIRDRVQAEIAQEAAAAGMTVEEYAAAGFEAPQQDSFSIYQLRNEDSTRDYRFEPYDRLQAAGLTVDKANYTEVYAAPPVSYTHLVWASSRCRSSFGKIRCAPQSFPPNRTKT